MTDPHGLTGRKGFVLVITLICVLIFTVAAGAFVALMVNESYAAKQQVNSTKAFFLAEAGARKSIYQMRQGLAGDEALTSLDGMGQYEVSVNGGVITAIGYYPNAAASGHSKRTIRVEVVVPTPPQFFDNAIVASKTIDLNGNYTVNGNLTYGIDIDSTGTGTVTGVQQQSDAVDPLPHLDFQQLRDIAQSQIKSNGQNNLYTAQDIRNGKPFPGSFWFDQVNGIPNVVYVEADLILRGDVGVLGGFFVVVGNVLTNPNIIQDATINGNGSIEGFIYTLGNFRINGGGNGFGVNGGVWAGNEARLNGKATVTYNSTYMDAIKLLDIDYELQIISWQEIPGQ